MADWVFQRRLVRLLEVPCEISCPSVFHRSFHCLCCTLDNCWILVPWSKSVSAFYRLKECTKALSLKCISVNSGIEFDLWGSWGRLAGGTSRVGPLSLSQPQVMANYIFISPRSKAVRKTCFQNHLPSWEHAAISRQKSVICFVWWGKQKSLLHTVETTHKLHHSPPVDANELIHSTVANVLKSLSWQNRAHHFENFTSFLCFSFQCVCVI